MEQIMEEMRLRRALQQPEWTDPEQVRLVRRTLAARPSLVRLEDVLTLRSQLASVASGEALVIQSGDCAEDPAECSRSDVWPKCAVLDHLAAELTMVAHRPVVRVGRIAGQFAKPRSQPVERVGDRELPSYRGHMVNGPEPDPASRRPDPLRILTGYTAASQIMVQLGWRDPRRKRHGPRIEPSVWTSHEALLLDYEVPMLREDDVGKRWLGSTHWPWIGERTRQVDGAHVALLAGVANPVACKVGPGMSPAELPALCEQLDPRREPGRLTLITRMGADVVADRLPSLVEAVRAAGHPVIWVSDPMHGNTVSGPDGAKIRFVETIRREVKDFRHAVEAAGGVAGGLHLETTPHDVTECHTGTEPRPGPAVNGAVVSLCDPRLSLSQARSVVAAWHDEAA